MTKARSNSITPAAKGDLRIGNGSLTSGILAVGSDNQVLTADSTQTTGVKWATASSGGMTSLASGSLSGSSLVLSSISGSYNNLQLILTNFYPSSNGGLRLTVNSVTDYDYCGIDRAGTTNDYEGATAQAYIQLNKYEISNSDNDYEAVINIYDYANDQANKAIDTFIGYKNSGGNKESTKLFGSSKNTGAVTSITLTLSVGTFSAGTYKLYGVK